MVAIADSVVTGATLAIAAVVFGGIVTAAFRRSLVSFRYWFGWLAVAAVLFVAGIVLAALPDQFDVFGLGVLQAGGMLFLLVNLLIAVQLSISISGHEKMITSLAQDNAELRRRVELLEGLSRRATAGESTTPTE